MGEVHPAAHRQGLRDRVVTDRGVLEVTDGGLVLVGTAPGVTAAEITAATDAALTLAEPLDEGPKEPKEQQ
ncbi:acyl CoA:acetate/3-ketoacid CoA transferase beta subunit [Streptomyces sp. B3I7]|nr:acyl CoA:acetate/3-ketoacid CoA transferase beta subunit [Streptomyces sp. B3I7]